MKLSELIAVVGDENILVHMPQVHEVVVDVGNEQAAATLLAPRDFAQRMSPLSAVKHHVLVVLIPQAVQDIRLATHAWDVARGNFARNWITFDELMASLEAQGFKEGELDALIYHIEKLPFITTDEGMMFTDSRTVEGPLPTAALPTPLVCRVAAVAEGWKKQEAVFEGWGKQIEAKVLSNCREELERMVASHVEDVKAWREPKRG
ncbi:hypothetical protein GCM10023213_19780 [Prosthecobacter algae]|uniref:Uncharacterized protein n=1 Tax=Prosthecobacter algae TaxID=1144682 RepID=A0ABP9P8E5_9BACT